MSDEYPKKSSSSSSTIQGYSVEARYSGGEPKALGKQIFDNRWRTVQYDTGPTIGIPVSRHAERQLTERCLYNYSAAQALRWWLHANADATFDGICLESKLIKHEIKTVSECTAVSEHKLISGEDRSNMMPE